MAITLKQISEKYPDISVAIVETIYSMENMIQKVMN